MASTYNINWQSGGSEGIPGKNDIVLPSNTNDSTSTTLTLTGRGVTDYGQIQQENFIRLMEHFASQTPPQNPTIGQLWYNASESILYVRADPNQILNWEPRYFPQSPASWVQVYPVRETYAGMSEYNVLATALNQILGPLSAAPANDMFPELPYGWGQTDLVPIYDDVNDLHAGQTAPSGFNYPVQFDNNAWVILLARLRKALKQVGLDPTTVSPYGFINDGRPINTGNPLSDKYNTDIPTPAQNNYTKGWGQFGIVSMQQFYLDTINALANLRINRGSFYPGGVGIDGTGVGGFQTQMLVTATRDPDWSSDISHTIVLTFSSQQQIDDYFKSGGSLKFAFNLTPTASPNGLSSAWSQWLSNISGFAFDIHGLRISAGKYLDNTNGINFGYSSLDMNALPKVVYSQRLSLLSSSSSIIYSQQDLNTIVDNGLVITVQMQTVGSTVVLTFVVTFKENPALSEFGTGPVSGHLVSSMEGIKIMSTVPNAPLVNFPATTGSSTVIS